MHHKKRYTLRGTSLSVMFILTCHAFIYLYFGTQHKKLVKGTTDLKSKADRLMHLKKLQ